METNGKGDETFIAHALSSWMNLTSDTKSCNLAVQKRMLPTMLTGPTIDATVNINKEPHYRVHLTACRGNQGDIWSCDGRVIDVPADGNCGFFAMCQAAAPFKCITALGTEMPRTVAEVRNLFVDFLRARRKDIEDTVVQEHGIDMANAFLWRDIRDSTSSTRLQMSFNELCESIPNCGMDGHWLGAGIGEIEIHLLGRCLGVTVHCVMAARERNGSYCLRQTFRPNPAFWKGKLQGVCRGAVVLRFLGSYSSGHYQYVRCGHSVMQRDLPDRRNPTTSTVAIKKSAKVLHEDVNMKQHMLAIYKMHGVQSMTKKRYSKDYRLISQAFSSLKEKG